MFIPIWEIVTLVILIFIYLVIALYQFYKVLRPTWTRLQINTYSGLKRLYVPILTVVAFGVFGVAICYYLIDIAKTVHNLVGQLVDLSSQKITPPSADTPSENDLSTVLKNLAQGSALLLGALVAAATLVFTLIKTWINERTTTADEEGLITDRINAAVASLGAEKNDQRGRSGTNRPKYRSPHRRHPCP